MQAVFSNRKPSKPQEIRNTQPTSEREFSKFRHGKDYFDSLGQEVTKRQFPFNFFSIDAKLKKFSVDIKGATANL